MAWKLFWMWPRGKSQRPAKCSSTPRAKYRRLALEALESRQLLTGSPAVVPLAGLLAGNTVQYQAAVTANSPDGSYGNVGVTPGPLNRGLNSAGNAPSPDWAAHSGPMGLQTTNFDNGNGFDQAAAVAMDNGNILVAGTTAAGQFGLVRYLDQVSNPSNDGQPDTAFGDGGLVTTTFADGSATATAMVADSRNHTIVVAGQVAASNGDTEVALARYNDTDGSLDTTFGPNSDGTVTLDLGSGWTHTSAVAVDGYQTIFVAGCLNGQFAVLHFNSDGSQDADFGNGVAISGSGIATASFGGTDETPSAMALESGGRIIVAGTSTQPTTGKDFAVAQFYSDGSLTIGGAITTNFGGDDVATSVAIQSDGKVLVAGYSVLYGTSYFAVARYSTLGGVLLLDRSFGNSGLVTTSFGDGYDQAAGIALQSDGKIVVWARRS